MQSAAQGIWTWRFTAGWKDAGMKRRIAILLLTFLCAGLLWATWSKGRQLGELRAKESELLASAPAGSENLVAPAETTPVSSGAQPAENPNTPELLRLRAEVNRLMRRKQELSSAVAENRRLKSQLASIGSNSKSSLGADYIRKANAQNRGYTTPQAALETFLWAARSKNLTNFLDAFTPGAASEMQRSIQDDPETFFKEIDAMPGLRVIQTKRITPDHVRFVLEMIPGADPMPIDLKLTNGQWKLEKMR